MEVDHLQTGEKLDEEPEKDRKSRRKGLGAVAVESNPIEAVKKAPEHIGHMLLNKREEEPKPVKSRGEKSVNTLSRAELLRLSEQITIDGSTLRQIYETRLIGERGLRRLVVEHLSGGDIKKTLRQEIVEREIDFERDPNLRDKIPLEYLDEIKAMDKTGHEAEFNKMLEKAIKDLPAGSEEAAYFKARANFEASQLSQHKQQRRILDTTLVVVIAALILFILLLVLGRR